MREIGKHWTVPYPLMGYARCWLPRTRALISWALSFFKKASNFASSTSLQDT